MPSSRDRLVTILTPMLPAPFVTVRRNTVRKLDTLAAPVVLIDYTAITHDGMPAGTMVDSFDVALVSHLTDYAKAEDLLDPAVRAFTRALDASTEIAWVRADKRQLEDRYLSWIVTVQLPSNAHQE